MRWFTFLTVAVAILSVDEAMAQQVIHPNQDKSSILKEFDDALKEADRSRRGTKSAADPGSQSSSQGSEGSQRENAAADGTSGSSTSWRNNDGVIAVGRRPDGSRAEAPQRTHLILEERDGKVTRYYCYSESQCKRLFEKIDRQGILTGARPFRKSFDSLDEADDYFRRRQEQVKRDAEEEAKIRADKQAEIRAQEEAKKLAEAAAQEEAKRRAEAEKRAQEEIRRLAEAAQELAEAVAQEEARKLAEAAAQEEARKRAEAAKKRAQEEAERAAYGKASAAAGQVESTKRRYDEAERELRDARRKQDRALAEYRALQYRHCPNRESWSNCGHSAIKNWYRNRKNAMYSDYLRAWEHTQSRISAATAAEFAHKRAKREFQRAVENAESVGCRFPSGVTHKWFVGN